MRSLGTQRSAIGALLATIAALFTFQVSAQTVTWDRQALGQVFQLHCADSQGGNHPFTITYPNNHNWSQSLLNGTNPCGFLVVTQPSNWTTTNAPNGTSYDVFLGSAGGAPTLLDIDVTLKSLTIQIDGGLTMGSRSLAAGTVNLQGDVGIGGVGTLINQGLFRKSAGTGESIIAPMFNNLGAPSKLTAAN